MQFLCKIWFENGTEMARFIFRATATAPLFLTLAPPRRSPPFLVRASDLVALKVAQVPCTAYWLYSLPKIYYLLIIHNTVPSDMQGGSG